MKSKIFLSTIVHKRYLPFKHKFKYVVPGLFINLNELDKLEKTFKLFSVNSFNIFSFFEKDHGFRDNRSIKEFVIFYLKKYKISYDKLNIKILCFPRILGYVFNPLSILYCYDNEKLISIFYEVKNTSNEQHTYVFKGKSKYEEFNLNHKCSKQFYVSPFIKMEGDYYFKNKISKDKVNISIDLLNKNKKKVMSAYQVGNLTSFSSNGLLKFIFFNPLLGFKVIIAILFESLRIIYKGGKYYARNKKPNDTITLEGIF